MRIVRVAQYVARQRDIDRCMSSQISAEQRISGRGSPAREHSGAARAHEAHARRWGQWARARRAGPPVRFPTRRNGGGRQEEAMYRAKATRFAGKVIEMQRMMRVKAGLQQVVISADTSPVGGK